LVEQSAVNSEVMGRFDETPALSGHPEQASQQLILVASRNPAGHQQAELRIVGREDVGG
jgi:hypothetical protein